MDIETFQERIGIQFNNADLLQQALTHRSYVNEQGVGNADIEDNERLEYLGDAILDFVTADMLYNRYPEMSEGELTRLRAALVRTESLAQLAEEYGLGQALLMGKGEANSGGRERYNNLCGGFEAVIGAIYLDHGLQSVEDFIMPRLDELQIEVMDEALHKDPRSQFQERVQAEYSITPAYRMVAATGPDHEKQFTVAVFIGERTVAEGRGKSKRAAAQSAAKVALEMLQSGELQIPALLAEPVIEEVKLPEITDPSELAARAAVINFFDKVNFSRKKKAT